MYAIAPQLHMSVYLLAVASPADLFCQDQTCQYCHIHYHDKPSESVMTEMIIVMLDLANTSNYSTIKCSERTHKTQVQISEIQV